MRTGRRLAIDVGKVRVGLAVSDQSGIVARPLATIQRQETLSGTIELIAKAVEDYFLLEIYVGLPLALGGGVTASTEDAINFAKALESKIDVAVRMIDERLSTVTATANLTNSGFSAKKQRKIIDQEAAALILENALNQERLQGTPPGRTTSEF